MIFERNFGGTVSTFGSAVYISGEDDAIEIHNRLSILNALNIENLYAVPMPSAGGVKPFFHIDPNTKSPNVTQDYNNIVDQLHKIKNLKLICIDPIQVFCTLDLNVPEYAQFSISTMATLASETGASVIFSHHFKKTPVNDAKGAREAIRGTTGLVDGVRAAFVFWEKSDEFNKKICKDIGEYFEPGKVVHGSVVKANGRANYEIFTFIRDQNGFLQDRTSEILITNGYDIRFSLINAIAYAALSGKPYTRTGQNGLYNRRSEMPKNLHKLAKNKFEKISEELLQQKKIVQCMGGGSKEVKWLDVPTGPFARGEGEFQAGSVPNSHLPTGT